MNPVSYCSLFLHQMLLWEKGAEGRKLLQNCFCTVTFPADATGGETGGRSSPALRLIYISDISHDSIHMFLRFIALQTAKENKRIPAIQKLVAISSPIKLISNNYES